MSTSLTTAERALELYLLDPQQAQRLAHGAWLTAERDHDPLAASLARRALGLAAGQIADAGAAKAHLSAAVRLALRGGDVVLAARARSDLAYVLARQGRTDAALREIEAARPHLRDGEAGRLLMMQALVLKNVGRWEAALASYQLALPIVRSFGDTRSQAELLGNRGALHIDRGAPAAAYSDLQEADRLLDEVGGNELHRAITQHNLGCVAAMLGDVPTALARFDEAAVRYTRHRQVPTELWRDRCQLLLTSGLAGEARAAAEHAVRAAEQRGEPARLAEARLALAQAALADGERHLALETADEAARAFLRQRRTTWAALARWVTVQACLDSDAQPSAATVRRSAVKLEQAGWVTSAMEARLEAARLALAEGRVAMARTDLARVRTARSTQLVWSRLLGWHAEALLRVQAGDGAGARRAAARGLALAEEHRATLVATDLRARVSTRTSALAALGLATALDEGRPRCVFSWAERTRAASQIHNAVRPPVDEEFASSLAELRSVFSRRRYAVEAGQAAPPALRARQVALERIIRDRARVLPAAQRTKRSSATPAELARALGGRALIEYVHVDGQLHALSLVGGRLRLTELRGLREVCHELAFLPSTLRRLMEYPTRRASTAAGREVLERSGRVLDGFLLAPLADVVQDRELVVVPTGPLHDVPWSLLPSCRGRAVTVAPSATAWRMAALPDSERASRQVYVAGPDLEHAESEVLALATQTDAPEVFLGAAAVAEDVLAAMEGAGLVHIAAHAHIRTDNPLFSALALADGPLTVYDLERLRRPPRMVVLAACDSGRGSVLAGDETLGLASTLLSLGVHALVAPIVPVVDADTETLMLTLHRRLTEGDGLAAALAYAQQEAHDKDLGWASATAFVCLGAG